MARYRKIPVEVKAEQFTREHIPEGVCECLGNSWFHIHTLEGVMSGDYEDWVITGVKGERYFCKDDIFRLTYEKV